MKKILVVNDDAEARESLRNLFQIEYEVLLACDVSEAMETLASSDVDVILLEVAGSKKSQVPFLKELTDPHPDLPVIIISASKDAQPIMDSSKSGTIDFVTKPFNVPELKQVVWRTLENRKLLKKIKAMESDLSRHYPTDNLLGYSDLFEAAVEAAKEAAKHDLPVLIHGEGGTGKEMLARQIHHWSSHREEPFVGVYAATIPDSIIESELWGHDRSSSSQNGQAKQGRIDLAGSGTLFLDDIGSLPSSTQTQILRLIQLRTYVRRGGTGIRHSRARIIATTHQDLTERISSGDFLQELYFELNAVPIHLPPLRDRREDIPVLAEHFLETFRKTLQVKTSTIGTEALKALCVYDWPGNIRELKNVIERSLVLHGDHPTLTLDLLPDEFHRGKYNRNHETKRLEEDLSTSVDQVERELLIEALRSCGGVQTKAAKKLGTTRRILKYKMDKLKITWPLNTP